MFLYIVIGLVLLGMILIIRLQVKNILYKIRSKKKKGDLDDKT
jgi:hypothetical protein